MKKSIVNIEFKYPKPSRNIASSRDIVRVLMQMMQADGSVEYAGYMTDDELSDDLEFRIGTLKTPHQYRLLSDKERKQIATVVEATVSKCHKVLPHSNTPISIFVFPWFPSVEEASALFGVNAVAPHMCTIHLFLDSENFTVESVKETIAHEYNHLVFYENHQDDNYTLLEQMLIEGLAEHFREELIGGASAPWATALTEKDSAKLLESLRPFLGSKNRRLCRQVLYGSKKYKPWTGYSIGYWLIKEFRKKRDSLAWKDVMKLETGQIFKVKK